MRKICCTILASNRVISFICLTQRPMLFIWLQYSCCEMINSFFIWFFSTSKYFDADHFEDCHNECTRSDRNGRTSDAKYKNITRTSRLSNNPMAKPSTQPQYHNNPFVFKCELTAMQKISVSIELVFDWVANAENLASIIENGVGHSEIQPLNAIFAKQILFSEATDYEFWLLFVSQFCSVIFKISYRKCCQIIRRM